MVIRPRQDPNPLDVQPIPNNTESYARLCVICKMVRVHKHSRDQVCPDCGAHARQEEFFMQKKRTEELLKRKDEEQKSAQEKS